MNHKKFFSSVLAVGLVVMLLLPTIALAGSISIEPLRQELELKPGQAVTNTILVRNTGSDISTVKLSAESFSVINEQYDYSFAKAEELQRWVSFNQSGAELKPGEGHSFIYTLGVPVDAEPGGRYIAIFSSASATQNASVITIERVGTLIYLTIPGNVTRTGSLLSLRWPTFSTSRSLKWDLRIHNTGTAHFKTRITTSVTSLFGGTSTTVTDEHLLLPNTIRHLEGGFGLGNIPGIYHIKILIGQGDSPAYTQAKWVFYMPIAPSLALIGLCATGFYIVVRKLRRRSKS